MFIIFRLLGVFEWINSFIKIYPSVSLSLKRSREAPIQLLIISKITPTARVLSLNNGPSTGPINLAFPRPPTPHSLLELPSEMSRNTRTSREPPQLKKTERITNAAPPCGPGLCRFEESRYNVSHVRTSPTAALSWPRSTHSVSASPPSTHTLCVSGGTFDFCCCYKLEPAPLLLWVGREALTVSRPPLPPHTRSVSLEEIFFVFFFYKLEPAPLLLWAGREALTLSRPPLPPHTRSVSLDESSIFCFCSFVLLEVRTRTKCKAQMWISLQHLWEGITQ